MLNRLKTKTGKLKAKYHDMPRFPTITNGYEDEFKDNYSKMLKRMVLEVGKKMAILKLKRNG